MSKCGRIECSKEAVPGMKYCSRECAPWGFYGLSKDGREESTVSEKTEKSTISRHGGLLSQSSRDAIAKERATFKLKTLRLIESTETKSKRNTMKSTKTQCESEVEKNIGEQPMNKDEPGTSNERKMQSAPIPLADSRGALVSAEMEKSLSMNLVEDSMKQMHELMSCIVKEQKTEKSIDAVKVKAAIGCAGQIKDLIKLKLDVYKELNKKGR